MSIHSIEQGRLSGGCVVTVCAVMIMLFSKLCNYISNYYHYYYYYYYWMCV